MKFSALEIDDNDRSAMTITEVPLFQVSETEWVSEKQSANSWSVATRTPGEPFDGGPTEMHLTNFPALICCLQGHFEVTGQDGDTCRLAPGDGIVIDGPALHHSRFGPSRVPILYLTLAFPGTQSHDFT